MQGFFQSLFARRVDSFLFWEYNIKNEGKEQKMEALVSYTLVALCGVGLLCLSMLLHKKQIMPRLREQVRIDGKDAGMRDAVKSVKTASVVQNDPFDGIDTNPPGFFKKKK